VKQLEDYTVRLVLRVCRVILVASRKAAKECSPRRKPWEESNPEERKNTPHSGNWKEFLNAGNEENR
jgi:hypothetical protein